MAINNIRSFGATALELRYPGEALPSKNPAQNVTLLLGNNGAGKTTVLRSLSLAVLGQMLTRSGFVPYYLIRRGQERGGASSEVLLHDQDMGAGRNPAELFDGTVTARTTLTRDQNYEIVEGEWVPVIPHSLLLDDDSPGFFMVGYGATRRVETGAFSPSSEEKRRRVRYARVASLFEESVALAPLTSWLPLYEREKPRIHERAIKFINRLLPDELRFEGELNGHRRSLREQEYLFRHRGQSLPFTALSDGYRAYAGWVADLACHLASVADGRHELWEYTGVVMIDEVDLHLHPELQRRVVNLIANGLPNMQLVFTSHSPIVAGTLKSENIYLMEPGPNGTSTAKQLDERIFGLNADQVLVSSYFNLSTTRAPDFVTQTRELMERAWAGDQEAALAVMRQLADKSPSAEEAPPTTSPKKRGGNRGGRGG